MKKAVILMAVLLVASVALAASLSGSATAPNMNLKGVEYIREVSTGGPSVIGGRLITNVSYTYNVHRMCAFNDPISGACVYTNAMTTERYLCMTTTQTGPVNLAPDLVCEDNLQPGTNSTSRFNGIRINASNRKPRWYFGFIQSGAGGISPVYEGRTVGVTVSY